jgi:hypothetical protein
MQMFAYLTIDGRIGRATKQSLKEAGLKGSVFGGLYVGKGALVIVGDNADLISRVLTLGGRTNLMPRKDIGNCFVSDISVWAEDPEEARKLYEVILPHIQKKMLYNSLAR